MKSSWHPSLPSLGRALVAVALPLTVAHAAPLMERPKADLIDATNSHLPSSPDLHAMDGAALDVDHDGDLDLAIAVEYGVNRLYLNDGRGKFTYVPGVFGNVPHDSEHVRTADFNRDGHADVVLVAESDEVHQLFLGDGKGGFVDASDRLPRHSQGNALAVGDLDGNGLPDIVIGNTGEPQPGEQGESPARNFLWLNDARNPGHFVDATLTHLPSTDDQSEGLALADMDGDGDLDILVASATKTNRLLLNDGRGRFSDASDRLQLLAPMETREVHAFDANRDGRLDIFYSNITSNNQGWVKDPQSRLLINDGTGRYRDETATRLPRHAFSSWAATIIDFNYDGAPDVLVGAIEVPGFVPLQMRAWQNDGRGKFSDVTLRVVPSLAVGRSWSTAVGDFDGDGKADVFVGQWGMQARLLLTDKEKYLSGFPRFQLLRPERMRPVQGAKR